MSKAGEMADPSSDPQYQQLLDRISTTSVEGQRHAYQAVSEHLSATNWRIGQHIIEFEQDGRARADYGTGKCLHCTLDMRKFSARWLIRIK